MFRENSLVPEYPENFLLPNGEKALKKELATLPKKSPRALEIKRLLKLPVVNVTEQNLYALPGNGLKLRFTDTYKSIYCFLDGTHPVKEHKKLPPNAKIVLASSNLGKTLLGKKKGDEGTLSFNNELRPFMIEIIEPHSRAKWVPRFSKYLQ